MIPPRGALLLLVVRACVLAAQNGTIAITGVTVVDGTGAPPQRHTVIVREGRIAALLPAASPAPAGATEVDGQGKFLLPGFWDMHVHVTKAGSNVLPVFVANGVLGVRDMGGDWDTIRVMRAAVSRGTRLGPRIVAADAIRAQRALPLPSGRRQSP